MRAEWTSELASIERPEVLEALANLLGVSDFLWDDFLRMQHTNLFPMVVDPKSLGAAKTKSQLREELRGHMTEAKDLQTKHDILNAFKDREMFRIDMRFIQRMIPEFWLFSAELTHLGEIILESAFELNIGELQAQHGEPLHEDGSPCKICVCGLGKFGGREIGFASDIELMFLYSGHGMTSGPEQIANSEFLAKLVHAIGHAIKAKREGIFELDLRLRPYGKASGLGVTVDRFHKYFAPDGPAWNYERQALVKLRPLLGEPDFCKEIVAVRDRCIYTGEVFDVAALRAIRERQVRQLVKGGTVNAKFSPGGLVDLEYLVQALQITYGHELPELRQTNTASVLIALVRIGLLSSEDYILLDEALEFLRKLIQGLRIVRGNARDLTIPAIGSDEFVFLARRLGYDRNHSALQEDVHRHTSNIQNASARLLQF
jgi:glutamate-ammonia-ligase adenylyltransferase